MKKSQLTCVVAALVTLFQSLNVYGYGTSSSGRASTTTTSSPYSEFGSQEQWGGVGHGENQQPPSRGRPTDNYGQASQQRPSDRYENDDSQGGANYFARENHVERYGYPESCVKQPDPQNACNYYVEIAKEREDPDHLHFELSTHLREPEKGGYVAVGLSKDKMMGDDHIVECVKQPGDATATTSAYHSWSTGRAPLTRLRDDLSVISMDATYPRYDEYSKILTCRFKRSIITHVQIPSGPPIKFDLEKGKYFVLLAVGPLRNKNSDQAGYHGDKPLVSGDAYVSPHLLGTSQEKYPPMTERGPYSGFNGSNGQTVESFILLFCSFFVLFY